VFGHGGFGGEDMARDRDLNDGNLGQNRQTTMGFGDKRSVTPEVDGIFIIKKY